MSYDNPQTLMYRVPALAVTGAAAVTARLIGPAGKKGMVRDIAHVVTTGVTVAAATVSLGDGTTANKYGTKTIAVSAANSATNGGSGFAEIAEDQLVSITTGGATAGAVDLLLTVDWY